MTCPSSYMFGVQRGRRHPARTRAKWDRICREEGGYGYDEIDESHGTAAGGRWIGWFSGPNLGSPFDRALANAVLTRCGLLPDEGGAQ